MNLMRDTSQQHSLPGVFSVLSKSFNRILGLMFGLAGIALILYLDARLRNQPGLPDFSSDVSYGLLFSVGLLTGFHCVGMCGALVLGYTTRSTREGKLRYSGHLLYGLGKTISYTAIGALFGLAGAIVSFTPQIRGYVGMAAGAFLLVFGLSLMNIWPGLHHFRIKAPAFLLKFIGSQSRKYGHPFVIGLLNGLMIICGPLQAMYIMAAGTGSALQGAKLMLIFGLGTLPVMLSFGLLSSMASARLAPRIIQLSGIIVVVLGTIMLNRGLVLSGSGYDFTTGLAWVSAQIRDQWGIDIPAAGPDYQSIETNLAENGSNSNVIRLKRGVPVKWKIHTDEVKACISRVLVPRLGLDIPIKKGDQTIEFTPQQEGVITWSCDMGMATGAFVVEENKPADQPPPTGSDTAETTMPSGH
jgi:sulfite exporter TauE/SafE